VRLRREAAEVDEARRHGGSRSPCWRLRPTAARPPGARRAGRTDQWHNPAIAL